MEGQENDMDAALIAEDGKTSAQILAEIKEQQKALKEEPRKASEPEPAPAPEPEPAVPPKQEDKLSEPAQPSSADEVVAPPGESDKATEEWMTKKGFKSTAEMARSLRNLERELSRRPKGPSEPKGTFIPRPAQPAPAYVPPTPTVRPPTSMIDDLAKQYNMDPEDLQRVAPLAADIASNAIRQQVQPLVGEITRLNKQVARKAEIDGLESDPAYQNPGVQVEMYKILEADPSIFQTEPAPYKYAFKEALSVLGRRNLEGKSSSENKNVDLEVITGNDVSSKPPATARGKSSGPRSKSGMSAPTQMNNVTFASLPLAEKEKYLRQSGAMFDEE